MILENFERRSPQRCSIDGRGNRAWIDATVIPARQVSVADFPLAVRSNVRCDQCRAHTYAAEPIKIVPEKFDSEQILPRDRRSLEAYNSLRGLANSNIMWKHRHKC